MKSIYSYFHCIITGLSILLTLAAFSQEGGVAINDDGDAPNSSAMLHVQSTIKGLLIPRMTTEQRDAISLPAKDLIVLCTSDSWFYVNMGLPVSPNWVVLNTPWMVNGSDISYQIGNVGIGTTSPNASAILDVNSTTKGFLPPRMTQSEIEAIISPANGLMVFCTTDNKFYVYFSDEIKWKELQYGSGEIILSASYTIGSGGSCSNTTVNGSYYSGVALDGSNTVNIDATVTTPGTWNITTDTLNGYSFSGSGTFTTTGSVQVTLTGTGIPTTAQTDNFTATANDIGGTCTFSVPVNIHVCGAPITDIDGNTYNNVLIGAQCWMKENLKTTTYRNGTAIPNITDNTAWSNLTTGAYVWMYNDIGWKASYGALYNWYATVDTNGICPTDWHVATDAEWTALTTYIGGTDSPHGNELKSCRQVNSPLGGDCNTTEHPRWNEHASNYGTDDYDFSGLPGGYRFYDGTFNSVGFSGYWWSSTEYSSDEAWFRFLGYGNGYVYVNYHNKRWGNSIRCLRDY